MRQIDRCACRFDPTGPGRQPLCNRVRWRGLQTESTVDRKNLAGDEVRRGCEEHRRLRDLFTRTIPFHWRISRHGTLYFEEWGYDSRFEALVAEIVGKFVREFDAKRERCWIAEREGEILGCVFLVKASKTVAKLRLLLVEPSARGLGLGKRLVDECVAFARTSGYRKIVLWTQSELVAARHIYQKAGFSIAGEERHSSWGRGELVSEIWEMKL